MSEDAISRLQRIAEENTAAHNAINDALVTLVNARAAAIMGLDQPAKAHIACEQVSRALDAAIALLRGE